jgi:DNA-binding IclR family transcriptional regulator
MEPGLVKSAARALQILEVFANERRPLSATYLGGVLGYPKSSLSVLLKSLVTQGYLSLGRAEGDFFPTLKVAQLGDWVMAALLGSDTIVAELEALRLETGETVTLTMANDLQMRCLRAFIGVHPISLQVEEGVTFPIVGTAIGTAYLAAQSEERANALLERWGKTNGLESARLAGVRKEIAECRNAGYCATYDAVLPDTGAIAMAVHNPLKTDDSVLVVAVAGLSSRISSQEKSLIEAMRRILKARLQTQA